MPDAGDAPEARDAVEQLLQFAKKKRSSAWRSTPGIKAAIRDTAGRLRPLGPAGAQALATSIEELVHCRNRDIDLLLYAASELEPTPDLVDAVRIAQAQRAQDDTSVFRGRFPPEIEDESSLSGRVTRWSLDTAVKVGQVSEALLETWARSGPGPGLAAVWVPPDVDELTRAGDVETLLATISAEDEDDSLRTARVLEALGSLHDARAVEPLLDALDLSDVPGSWVEQGRFHEGIVRALTEIGGVRATEGLARRLGRLTTQDGTEWERRYVVVALADLADTDTRPALVDALPTFAAVVDDADAFDLTEKYRSSDDPRDEDIRLSHERDAWAAVRTILLFIGEPAVPVVRAALDREQRGARHHRWSSQPDLALEDCLRQLTTGGAA